MPQFFSTILFLSIPSQLYASRAVGGELTYNYNTSTNQYEVLLTIYYNCAARSPLLNNYTVNYKSVSCGKQGTFTVSKRSEELASPSCNSQKTTCEGGKAFGFKKAVYSGLFKPSATCTDWIISWVECNRNNEINTIESPSSKCLYLELRCP